MRNCEDNYISKKLLLSKYYPYYQRHVSELNKNRLCETKYVKDIIKLPLFNNVLEIFT